MHGGIGRYAFELLKAELEQDKTDKFFVFYNDHVATEDLDALNQYLNVELVRTSARHYSVAEQTSFLRVLNNAPVDVVHFPNFNHPILYKKPFVVTIHDMVHEKISGHKKSRWLSFKAYQMEMRHAVLSSRAIIVPSEFSKGEVLEYYPGVDSKIKIIHEGVTLEEQTPEYVAIVKEQFLLNRPYFLFVGTLERKKNIFMLAKGFDYLVEKYKLDVDLVFAGKQDLHYPEEKEKVLSIKHKARVVFTGFVEDNVLAALFGGAHAYVNASLHEGFGLPGVEAMHFGLPLAVSNTPVFNEIYDDAAVYFDASSPEDIAEKLRLLAQDKQFYELRQEKSLERSRFFDWHRAARETLAVLRASSNLPEPVSISVNLVQEI